MNRSDVADVRSPVGVSRDGAGASSLAALEPGPIRRDAGLWLAGHWVWDGGVVRGEDHRYHLFASRWPKALPFTAWATHAEIIHAVADRPVGPFRDAQPILPPTRDAWQGGARMNPEVHRIDGRWIMLYTATARIGAPLAEDEPASPDRWRAAWNTQRLAAAVADAPEGPWRCLDRPLLEPRPDAWDAVITSNPTLAPLPRRNADGSSESGHGFLLIYKSIAEPYVGDRLPTRFRLGAARSESPLGPFTRDSDAPLFDAPPGLDLEDPCVVRFGDRFEMIGKDMNGRATGVERGCFLAAGADGRRWSLASLQPWCDKRLVGDDGVGFEPLFMERPRLASLDPATAEPDHVAFSVALGEGGYGGITDAGVCVAPLRPRRREPSVPTTHGNR